MHFQLLTIKLLSEFTLHRYEHQAQRVDMIIEIFECYKFGLSKE